MTASAAPPLAPGPGELVASTRAMAMEPRLRIPGRSADPEAAAHAAAALAVFEEIERSCTRFDPASALMRANAAATRFQPVPPECLAAIRLAHSAYEATAGRFDPRVLGDLVRMGYDRSLRFSGGEVETANAPRRRGPLPPWRPRFRSGEVCVGPVPIDLGGIGKGLAVRLAGDRLARAGITSFLLDAGGDCLCAGEAPDGGPWMIGVEDPSGAPSHLAVLALSGHACATSSTRVRQWRAGGRPAHHLIDPRTGMPGGGGLAAVTVVARDPAWAEVWSKSLLLAGPEEAVALAERRALAALFVGGHGELTVSRAMERFAVWRSGTAGCREAGA